MCGWANQGLLGSPQPITLRSAGTSKTKTISCWLSSIEREDERQVRSRFSDTYKHLFEQYPAIRKMVKIALRKELGVSDGDASARSKNEGEEHSAIAKHYWELGGDFIVCTQAKDTNENDDFVSEKAKSSGGRRVLGGIGIRKFTKKEQAARQLSLDDACYEIHHLFVDAETRGCGLGTELLNAALDMIVRAQSPRRRRINRPRRVLVLATTLSVLENANRLYSAKGFTISSEVQNGDLLMRTYTKTIDLT